jgi:hypothetical protein
MIKYDIKASLNFNRSNDARRRRPALGQQGDNCVFAHDSGSRRRSPRNKCVADMLQKA